MKQAYPVILEEDKGTYVVFVPDMNINTQGHGIAEAMMMAEDAIGLCGITMQDMGQVIPKPSKELPKVKGKEIAQFVLVDFDAYRRKNDMRTIRKNVSLPNYMNEWAEEAGLNCSHLLQDAIRIQMEKSKAI